MPDFSPCSPPAPCPIASSTVTPSCLRANYSEKSFAIAWAISGFRARIIETEAYYVAEKGSHASLGYTEKRKALFLDGGHIYMYYARGGDSLNFSAHGPGNAVLIKSAYPWVDDISGAASLAQMLLNNPNPDGSPRPSQKLCAGQTLLCKALGLKVPMWDAKRFDQELLYVEDVGQVPTADYPDHAPGYPQRAR